MHASLNVGYQGKSGPGKIHEVILALQTFNCHIYEHLTVAFHEHLTVAFYEHFTVAFYEHLTAEFYQHLTAAVYEH